MSEVRHDLSAQFKQLPVLCVIHISHDVSMGSWWGMAGSHTRGPFSLACLLRALLWVQERLPLPMHPFAIWITADRTIEL